MGAMSTSPSTASSPTGHLGLAQWARSILLLGVPKSSSERVRIAIVAGMVLGATTVAASGAIHLHLWISGYRHVARIGPLFLAQAISGFVLAVVIVVSRRMFGIVAGALFQIASVIGLVLSATVGFLGLHDGLGVPWATNSIIVELIGFVILTFCGLALVARR